ncbi:hypothetical protein KKA87_03395 [bacterium]|nr:hypothetical protein [bacterium]MBU1873941.1 hypothetical protein [bacterium]
MFHYKIEKLQQDIKVYLPEILISILIILLTIFLTAFWKFLYNGVLVDIPAPIKYISVLVLLIWLLIESSRKRHLQTEIKKLKGLDSPIKLSDIEQKVLKSLYEINSNNISPINILSSIDIDKENKKSEYVLYILGKLQKMGLVSSRRIAPFDDSNERYWSISQKGREYLLEK